MGAIVKLRQEFTEALGGVGNVSTFTHDYGAHDGVQFEILSASGMWSDGKAFSIKSDRLRAGADLTVAAQELARRLLDEKAKSP